MKLIGKKMWNGFLRSRLFWGVVGLVVGAVLTIFFINYNPKDEPLYDRASTVFGRIVDQNELVTVSQDYCIVDKNVDEGVSAFGLFYIPGTSNSFWYRYQGTIKAGVNLETAGIEVDGNVLTITLDPAYIVSNTPDMEKSGVLEENNNFLNAIHAADVDDFQRDCIEKSEADAVEGGLLEDARAGAEDRLTQLFYAAMGDDVSVQYVWREPVDDEAAQE